MVQLELDPSSELQESLQPFQSPDAIGCPSTVPCSDGAASLIRLIPLPLRHDLALAMLR